MAWIRLPTRNNPLSPSLNRLLYDQSSNPPKALTMAVCQSNAKRPTCPSCSKPSSLCLCNRIRNPGLDNKIGVTILQHSLERKHPLNSVRIAKLGLRNVTVVTVSDVNFDARFIIRLLESKSGTGGWESLNNGVLDKKETQKRKFGDIIGSSSVIENMVEGLADEEPDIYATMGKYGEINKLESKWQRKPQINAQEKPNFDQILTSEEAIEDLAKGFVVKKFQRKPSNGSSANMEEYEEFELVIPSGSVLLFPSEKALDVEELLQEINGVKNLIVLDGTWAKAKRMYKENPWLRIIPHLKLNLHKLSLYSEVRSQPKAGYLSTIESIVYALKAVGDDHEGLDSLLDVFESMVGDQRRCKDERLKNEHFT